MKKCFKILGAISIALVIGFSMVACGDHVLDGLSSNYSVTVNGGNGSGSYPSGSIVIISANVPSGQQFTGWVVNTNNVVLADPSSINTSFTMPVGSVTVTATFSGGGNNNGGTSSNSNSGGGTSSNGGGGNNVNTTITIVNNTSFSVTEVYVKPSTSNKWSADRETSTLANGTPKPYTIPAPYSATNEYDILLKNSSANQFRKYKVKITDGMTITFTADDLDNGSTLPTIYLRNRTGIAVSTVRIKPSGTADDWTIYEITINSNNTGDGYKLDMAIPLTSYSKYDFQFVSGNPINTFSKNNVDIVNGTFVTFGRTEAATPIGGDQILVIENNTGARATEVYVRPAGSEDWGTDLFTGNQYDFENKESQVINLPRTLTGQIYDIRLRSNAYYVQKNVPFTDGMLVNFVPGDKE